MNRRVLMFVVFFVALFLSLLSGNLLSVSIRAATEIPITSAYFPDEQFREFVSLYDANPRDGKLSQEEISSIEVMDCSHLQIENLQGVNIFSSLKYLNCSYNQLTELSLIRLSNLLYLNCEDNSIDRLDVSGSPSLLHLNCSSNDLSEIDLAKNSKLTHLYFDNNLLVSMDIRNNSNVEYLSCNNNFISALYLAYPSNLKYLDCSTNCMSYVPDISEECVLHFYPQRENTVSINQDNFPDESFRGFVSQYDNNPADGYLSLEERSSVTSINCSRRNIQSLKGIEYFASINSLNCSSNLIIELDLGNNICLTRIDCSNNKLERIDISKNTKLNNLNAWNNKLSNLILSNNIHLADLNCGINQLTELDVSKCLKLRKLTCSYTAISKLNLSDNSDLWELDCSENYSLRELNVGGCYSLSSLNCSSSPIEKLNLGNIEGLQDLSCSFCRLSSLDVSKNTNLRTLACDENQLKYLDLRGIHALERVICSNNSLIYLDVSSSEYLAFIDCDGNRLANIDIRKNTNLEELVCSNNLLTYLDVSNNPNLKYLSCQKNKIKNLDVSYNPILSALDCSNNQITCLEALDNPELYAIDCKDNLITELYIGMNTNPRSFNCSSNLLSKMPRVSENCNLTFLPQKEGYIEINETNFPDESFRNYVMIFDLNPVDGYLSSEERSAVKEIACSNRGIRNLKGLEYFSFLENLYCNDNELTDLDVSFLGELEVLRCENNKIKKLNLGYIPKLSTLVCSNNELETLYVYSHQLQLLKCEDNNLISLIVMENAPLNLLNCKNNYLREIPEVSSRCLIYYLPQKKVEQVTGLYCNTRTRTSVGFSWEELSNASGYEVYMSLSKDGVYNPIDNAVSANILVSELSPNTTYYFKVRAYMKISYSTIWGEYSEAFGVNTIANTPTPTKKATPTPTRPIVKPSAPSNIKAVSESASSVKVSWSKVSEADGYQIWRSTIKNGSYTALASVTNESRTCTGLKAGVKYYFKVRAYKEVDGTKIYGDFSEVVNATPIPSASTGLKTKTLSATKVNVFWNGVTGATGYEVFRSTSKEGTYSKLGAVMTTNRDCPGLTTGTTYYFKVRAYKEVDGVKVYGPYSSIVTVVPKPTTPTNVKTKVLTASKVKVSWNAVTGATGYEVYRSISENGTYSKLGAVTTTSRDCPSLKSGTTYYFKIRAYKEVNGTKIYSGYSSIVSATPKA